MASSPADLPVRYFEADDGARLAWRETGEGRPVVLLHGLFSNGYVNWIRWGHAVTIASAGFRVIMPDLRGHGHSAAPHEASSYPPDILVDDGFALVEHLGLEHYDIGGYSLGARTALRMLVRGASARRAVIMGMGLQGMLDTRSRVGHFRDVLTGLGQHPRGSPEWLAEAFLKTTGGDPRAMRPLLDSFVDTSPADLAAIDIPTVVIAGDEDQDNGSAAGLAASLPRGSYAVVPGNHMSAVVQPELGRAAMRFLISGDEASVQDVFPRASHGLISPGHNKTTRVD